MRFHGVRAEINLVLAGPTQCVLNRNILCSCFHYWIWFGPVRKIDSAHQYPIPKCCPSASSILPMKIWNRLRQSYKINWCPRMELFFHEFCWSDINIDWAAFAFIFGKSKSLESSLFWDVTQRRIGSWLPTLRGSNLLGSFLRNTQSKNSSWTALSFKIGPLGCPATSVTNYQSAPSNVPEEWISWTAWPLKMGPICRPETPVDWLIDLFIYWYTLGSSPYGPDAPRPYRQALCAP
jgi:hypothetical protein